MYPNAFYFKEHKCLIWISLGESVSTIQIKQSIEDIDQFTTIELPKKLNKKEVGKIAAQDAYHYTIPIREGITCTIVAQKVSSRTTNCHISADIDSFLIKSLTMLFWSGVALTALNLITILILIFSTLGLEKPRYDINSMSFWIPHVIVAIIAILLMLSFQFFKKYLSKRIIKIQDIILTKYRYSAQLIEGELDNTVFKEHKLNNSENLAPFLFHLLIAHVFFDAHWSYIVFASLLFGIGYVPYLIRKGLVNSRHMALVFKTKTLPIRVAANYLNMLIATNAFVYISIFIAKLIFKGEKPFGVKDVFESPEVLHSGKTIHETVEILANNPYFNILSVLFFFLISYFVLYTTFVSLTTMFTAGKSISKNFDAPIGQTQIPQIMNFTEDEIKGVITKGTFIIIFLINLFSIAYFYLFFQDLISINSTPMDTQYNLSFFQYPMAFSSALISKHTSSIPKEAIILYFMTPILLVLLMPLLFFTGRIIRNVLQLLFQRVSDKALIKTVEQCGYKRITLVKNAKITTPKAKWIFNWPIIELPQSQLESYKNQTTFPVIIHHEIYHLYKQKNERLLSLYSLFWGSGTNFFRLFSNPAKEELLADTFAVKNTTLEQTFDAIAENKLRNSKLTQRTFLTGIRNLISSLRHFYANDPTTMHVSEADRVDVIFQSNSVNLDVQSIKKKINHNTYFSHEIGAVIAIATTILLLTLFFNQVIL